MTAQRWQQVESILQAALDISSSAERASFIADACAGDDELRAAVERLIAADEEAETFIESPAWTSDGILNSAIERNIKNTFDEQSNSGNDLPDITDEFAGRKIGVFKLQKELGRGGMGAVYLATRADGEFRQEVAVKLIKRGMDTDFIVKRFRHERQILAALNHPNVARLIDGGTSDDGLPYFVMEYVEGAPLYRYCDERKLNTAERLRVFRRICEAVEAAHALKVVHRDLKPSNILVKTNGTPKLLDFGIAKILDADLASATLEPTATAMRLMTPEYASPEQVCGEPVSPASDIYSLGVLLYELLTGHRPYRFKNRALHEIHRAVCEEMPDVPSESLTREDNIVPTSEKATGAGEKTTAESTTLEIVFRARSTDFENLRRELAGDLDKIVLKTLRKNPAERYQTAAELADDINRFLQKRPVRAEWFGATEKISLAERKTGEFDLAGKQSAAILPFKIIGATNTKDTDGEEFLGIGLADALVTRLSIIKQIVVRPTSSVLAFAEKTVDAFRAGRDLAVDFVVDGNIRRTGSRIRVTVQLLSIAGNSTLWAQTFDEKFTDVLELEDSISERVAKSLLPQLTGEEQIRLHKRGTNNAAAYEAYLRGRFFWNQFTPDTFPKALEWFEKAVALDANYALAYVGIADFYNWATIFGMFSPPEGRRKTKAAAIRALEIDDKLSEAHAVLGFLTTFSDFDWTRGEYLLKHALELNPHNALAHEWYSALLAGVGRSQESEREILRAIELDPLSLREKTLTAWHLYQLRRFPAALAQADEIIEMNPLYYQGYFQRGNVLNEMGRSAEAVADLRKALEIAPEASYLYYKLCFALAAIGEPDEARRILRDFQKLPAAAASAYHLAMCYTALDERDAAFEWFNKAIENRDVWLVWLATDAKLDKFRDDERFNELLRKTNRAHLVRQIKNESKPVQTAAKVFAVLPFKFNTLATGGDTDDKFLGVGLTDALISRLSKAKNLIVRPTSSVLQFSETTDAFAAGRELAADFVLDGNVRRVGERIRVSVQLLNVNETATTWAETFDEKFTDILEVEDSIAERVAESLLPQLTGEEHRRISRRGTDSPAAYEAYLRGRFHWNQFTPESLSKAIESFQTAIRLDENYALAHVGVADFYTWANIYGLIPSARALDEAERAARRAVEIDERLGEAYASLGLGVQNRMRWAEAEKLKRQAIKLNPNYSIAHEWWAAQLVGTGATDEGVKEIRLAESLDPLSLRTKTLTAWTLSQAHHFDDALETARQIIELDKNYPQGYSQAGFALWAMGRHAEALPNFQKFDEMIPDFALAKYQLCFGFAAVNRHAEARRVLDEIKTLAAGGYVKPYFLAMAHVAVGELNAAFEYFEESFNEQEPWLLWFGTDPMLESLHDDARYADLLERMNNPIAAKFKARREAKNQPQTFAVLPFKLLQFNTGDDSEDQFLSVGLTDALITRLSKIRRVVVRPTSAVMRFGDAADAFQAGAELETDFVLAGNIRRAGNRVRVSAQLLKIADKTTAWADIFDQELTDVLELEDSISERVAASLAPRLSGDEQKHLQRRETSSPAAYEAFLKGRFYFYLMTEQGFARALEFYERAVALDPNYALAWAAIAEYYIFLAVHCVIPFADASRRAKDAAERAAALDPLLAEAQNALGIVAINHDFDWDAAEKYVVRALELNPNSFAVNQWAKTLYLQTGRFDSAFRYARRLFEIAPDSTMSVHFMAWTQHCARRFDAALESYNRLIAAEPLYAHARMSFSWTLRAVGKYAEAVEQARKATELAPENPLYRCTLAAALADDNQTEAARAALAEIEQTAQTKYVSPYMLALVRCALGDGDRAFAELERAFAIRDVWIVFAAVEPLFDFLRDDRRFDDLLRRMKHPLAAREKVVEIEKTIADSPIEVSERSIAVLPLTILGANTGNADDEYLGVGLADAMITRLSNVRRLVVRPTSSILRFGGCADSFAAGRELMVNFVICGTIRRAGTRLRISTQLLDVAKNATVWAGKFDEEFTDVLALEDLVAEKVGGLLISQLTGEERHQLAKRGTDKPAAYEAHLRGRFQWNQFTPDSLLKSIEFFKQAVRLEPEYALAFASMADCYYWLGAFGVGTPREHFAAARTAAGRAIEYDQTLGEAYSVLGFVSLFSALPFKWGEAEELCRRGLELGPNYAWGHIWYSAFLASTGRFDESINEARRALELDPLSPINQQHLGFMLYHARRFDEAARQYEKAIADHPDFGFVRGTYGWMLRAAGRLEESLTETRRAAELNPGTSLALCGLAATLYRLGETGEALELVRRIETEARERHFSPFHLAVMYANLGDVDRAFEQFEAALTDNDAWVIWLSVDPQLDVLRDDARYQNWLRRTGNPLAR